MSRSVAMSSTAMRVLVEEHRLIERGLDCLAALALGARRDGRLDGPAAVEALALVREYADRCHHAKEEDRLFAAMERAGLERDGGVLAVMIDEHESGREHARAMSAACEGAAAGDAGAIAIFERHARAIDALLREHIAKEDDVLFPLGDELIDGGGAAALLADFRQVELDAGGRRHAEWLARLDDLCRRCGLEPVTRSQVPTLAQEFL